MRPPILQLALLIAILLPAGKIVASLCTRFGAPAIIGELMVGIAAGPGGLNLLHLDLFHGGQSTGAFMLLAQIGGLDFHALGGHWGLLALIFIIAVLTKMIGCGLAALVRGMGPVRSLRIGCGMVSRGEVGLIVTAIAIKANVFSQQELALMVTVVLLTTILTPLALRGAFRLRCPEDDDDRSGTVEEWPDLLGAGELSA